MRRRHLALLAAACLCVELTSSDEMKNLLDRVTLLEERLRLTNIPELTDDEANERSLLEIFTDTIGDFVMHKLLPRSDAACRWNYAKSVCVPRCDCSFQHRAGDLTPGRACRLRPPDAHREACDPDVSGELGTLEKAATLVRTASARSWVAANRFLDAAAPPTDAECAWNWRLRSCDPPGRCELRYRFGDYHLGRACRLASDAAFDAFGGAAFDDEDLFDARDAPFGEADDDRDAAPAADRFGRPRRDAEADAFADAFADDDEADRFDAPDAPLDAAAPFGEADDDRDAAAAADRLGRRAGDAEFDAFAGAAFDAPEQDPFDAPDAPLGEADDDRDAAADLFGRADDDRDAADTS